LSVKTNLELEATIFGFK